MNCLVGISLLALWGFYTVHCVECSRETRGGTADGGENWGYTTAREGVHLFWWLYRTAHHLGHKNRPLLIWMQGGPGLSSTVLGNFLEIGPLDHELKPRSSTWLQEVSLLFIDSPVGAGFSYYDNQTLIPDNIYDNADDVYEVVVDVLSEHPEYMNVPLYIFGQSYGGKLAPALARRIQTDRSGRLRWLDLRGVGLGNGFTSPVHTVKNIGPYLYQMSLVDDALLEELQTMTDALPYTTSQGKVKDDNPLSLDSVVMLIYRKIPGLNVYDSSELYRKNRWGGNNTENTDDELVLTVYDIDVSSLVTDVIRPKVGIIPEHVTCCRDQNVYETNQATLLGSAVYLVEELLASGVHVVVYQGQYDIICSTAGATGWIRSMDWPHIQQYEATTRVVLEDPETRRIEMFAKDYQNLHMYWVMNAGHAVPHDVPDTSLRMLQRVLNTTAYT